MRTWGQSGAAAAIRQAQAVSRYARRSGCGVDEASEIVESHLSRRRFLIGAGATAAATGLSGLFADASGASPHADTSASVGSSTISARTGSAPTVVVVGSGIAGLGCAYRLWRHYGIRTQVHEYNTIPGGRIRTLRGYFDDQQTVEEHAEFINPEHTETLALAKSFGLTLDNSDKYPAGTHPNVETMRFGGRRWSQKALDKDWHDWAWRLFHDAAFKTAPWPTLYNSYTPGSRKWSLSLILSPSKAPCV